MTELVYPAQARAWPHRAEAICLCPVWLFCLTSLEYMGHVMDTKALVILPLPREDGKRLVELLDKNSLDVQAAFWGYQPEADEWQLYISTPLVASDGPLKVYRRIREL